MVNKDHATQTFAVPSEIMAFVNEDFLVVLSEDEAKKTVEFHIPSKRLTDTEGRTMAYSVTWIHPDFNDQFCHYYLNQPGDLPNFYVEKEFTDDASESIEGLDTVEDLVDWLESMKHADVA